MVKKNFLLILCSFWQIIYPTESAEQLVKQALTCQETGDISNALKLFKKTLALDPSYADTYYELGMLLHKQGHYKESYLYFSQALNLLPSKEINKSFKIGNKLLVIGYIDDALKAFCSILKYNPNNTNAHYNIGFAYKTAGKIDQAIEVYKTILAKEPNHELAHLALAMAYLMKGDFTNGWQEQAWTLKRLGRYGEDLRNLLQHNNVKEKIILLRYEGGLGDTINFIRYAKRLKELGATVYAVVQKPLVPLLSLCCPCVDKVLTLENEMPRHDAQATLMSLPAIFGDTEDNFALTIPYLHPVPSLTTGWQKALSSDKNLKIGLCWQSDVFNDSSRMPIARRGIPFELIHPFKNIPGISFYSLQKKEGFEQLNALPVDFKLQLFDGHFGIRDTHKPLPKNTSDFDQKNGGFMDTAAIMQHLDLIITVDSAIAHLAGATGRPVWLLLPYATDWRWISGRTDSPWYPTMRIFKQSQPFDWQQVADLVLNELQIWASAQQK